MKRLNRYGVGLLVCCIFALTACGGPPAQQEQAQQPEQEAAETGAETVETVTLQAGSSFPLGLRESHGYETFVEILNDQYPDHFKINFKGGPETFAPDEVGEAIRSGAIDVANVTGVYYGGMEPMAKAMVLPIQTPWTMRKNGVHDFFDKVHQRHGIKYLGRTYTGIPYKCYVNKKIEGPEGLKGQSIRTSPVYRPMLKHFGANPVTTPPGEVYTALDRGVVDGFCWPAAGVVDFGWHEKVDYVIDPGFFQVEVSLIMNQSTWNELSDAHKTALREATKLMERETFYWFQKESALERVRLEKAGVQTIEFTGDARKRYLDAARESYWQMLRDQAGEKDVKELQSLLDASKEQAELCC